ncbi:MAG: hypothetical protein AB7I79_22215 [Rhizobiaceae bacterium]
MSLRECRLVLERIMQHSGVHPGLLPAARDSALYSEAMGLGGLAAVRRYVAAPGWNQCKPLDITDDGDGTRVHCRGQHAWLVAEAVADILCDELRRKGNGKITILGVTQPDELPVVAAAAERHSIAVDISANAEHAVICGRLLNAPEGGGLLQRIRENGLSAPAGMWWELFHLGNQALEPDTPISRRHAGPKLVGADVGHGGTHGDEEDTAEFPFSLIDSSVPPEARLKEG